MIHYVPFEEHLHAIDAGKYISFGIKIVACDNRILMSVSDVSTNKGVVSDICNRCTLGELDPIHLFDVIEDSI